MDIDSLTEAQAKSLLEFAFAKQGFKISGMLDDDIERYYTIYLMARAGNATFYTGVYPGVKNSNMIKVAKCLLKIDSSQISKDTKYSSMLAAAYRLMYENKSSLILPHIPAYDGVVLLPKDKTIEEWLIEMDLER